MSEQDIVKLVQNCQKGNLEEFGSLYDEFIDKVYKFIYYRVNNREDAEDLTSKVFFKALDKIATFKLKEAKFSTWLFTIARNSVVDFYRAKREQVGLEWAEDVPSGKGADDGLDSRMFAEQALKYMQGLNSVQRDIVIMRVWDELSNREIAEVLGMSEDAVKVAYFRAIKQMKLHFGALALFMLVLARPLI